MIIKAISHKDEVFDDKKGKLYKIITVEFDNLNAIDVQRVELMNIEIERHNASNLNDDYTLDGEDVLIPVNLGHGNDQYNGNILTLRFIMGNTLFNEGAKFLITIKCNIDDDIETFIFTLKDNKWVYDADCKEIDYNSISYVKYLLVGAEWIKVGDKNGAIDC